ncbi:MAG: hypothetical protein MJY61_03430 [Bacteroidales bacterium]|nr:hypothetical protein [Bacteroidales bacterium]
MKKTIVIVIAALLSVAAIAQPRAIGGRLSLGVEVSYQHSVGPGFVEMDLGYDYASGAGITATYNFICATPNWTPRGTWKVYAGPGVSLGTYFRTIPFNLGICGQVGLEYTFWFPLQLSVDLRPSIGFGTSSNSFVYNTLGLFGFVPTFGVRYSFGQK